MPTVEELYNYDREHTESVLPNGDILCSGISRTIWKECPHCGTHYHDCDDYDYSAVNPIDFVYCPNDGNELEVKWEDARYCRVETPTMRRTACFAAAETLRRANPELVFEKFGQKKPLPDGTKQVEFKRYEPLS